MAISHLSDPSVYKKVPRMSAQTIERKINEVWRTTASDRCVKTSVTKSYISTNTDIPAFYCLIKTHKDGPQLKVRPIISNKNGPSMRLSWLLSRLLKPLLNTVPAHLENSMQLIEDIRGLESRGGANFVYPFSLDVVALYTSIPPAEAINAVKEKLQGDANNQHIRPFSPQQVADMLGVIFKNSFLTFNGMVFKQIGGLPMGNSVSGILAILYMDALEKTVLNSCRNIGLYRRYVDDVLLITTTKEEAEGIFKKFNEHTPEIQFEIEHPEEKDGIRSLALLDFELRLGEDSKASFSFYKKAAKRDIFPHFSSAMPLTTKNASILNEVKRISERCTDEQDRAAKLSDFQKVLNNRGYPKDTVDRARRRGRHRDRKPRESQVFFQMPFFNDATQWKLRKIFKEAELPVTLYNKSTTLRATLRAKLQRDSKSSKCDLDDCPMDASGLCLTRNCVYQLTCRMCGEFYIGSSIRHLHTRVREHYKSDRSSVFQHRKKCLSSFDIGILARSNDMKCLRFKEAIAIQEKTPKINSRSECDDLSRMTF